MKDRKILYCELCNTKTNKYYKVKQQEEDFLKSKKIIKIKYKLCKNCFRGQKWLKRKKN